MGALRRGGVSFVAMSDAQADVERVMGDIRSRLDDLTSGLEPAVAGLPEADAIRYRGAERDCTDAADDLCAVLEQIATALGTAREAGGALPNPPGWPRF